MNRTRTLKLSKILKTKHQEPEETTLLPGSFDLCGPKTQLAAESPIRIHTTVHSHRNLNRTGELPDLQSVRARHGASIGPAAASPHISRGLSEEAYERNQTESLLDVPRLGCSRNSQVSQGREDQPHTWLSLKGRTRGTQSRLWRYNRLTLRNLPRPLTQEFDRFASASLLRSKHLRTCHLQTQ